MVELAGVGTPDLFSAAKLETQSLRAECEAIRAELERHKSEHPDRETFVRDLRPLEASVEPVSFSDHNATDEAYAAATGESNEAEGEANQKNAPNPLNVLNFGFAGLVVDRFVSRHYVGPKECQRANRANTRFGMKMSARRGRRFRSCRESMCKCFGGEPLASHCLASAPVQLSIEESL
jgi:hypothetical protein